MSAPTPRSFTIHTCLGRGGFGEVYRAEMHRPGGIDAEVALKVLRRDMGMNDQAVRRLRDEGRLLSKLSHPAILKVHDLLLLEGRVALVTEFVDGQDLTACIEGPDPMPLRALLDVIGQVAGALDCAWSTPTEEGKPLRMVHRDVKPSNIRIGKRGTVKLLDFGIARTDEMTREAKTMTDMLVGSPPYMAPERFLAEKVEPASDVFALGATLAEGIAGRKVFDVPVTMLAGLAVSHDRYTAFVDERLAPLQEKMPAQVFALLRSMLAYEPDDRPAATDVSRACARLAYKQSGATLSRWARDHDWGVEEEEEAGELDGRQISEGTLEDTRLRAPLAPPTMDTLSAATGTTGGRVGLVMGGMSLLVLVGSVGVLVVALLLVGLAVWQPWSGDVAEAGVPEAPVAAAPVVEPEPAPEPEPEPEPIEQPEAAPEPAPRPKPAPEKPKAQPVRVVPVPKPQPEPAPAPAPQVSTARVEMVGKPSRLVRGGKVVNLPGDVPTGVWNVEAQFQGAEWTPTLTDQVIEGGRRYETRCGNWQCKVESL